MDVDLTAAGAVDVRERARIYAKNYGFAVIPIRPRSKIPAIKNWTQGKTASEYEAADFDSLFTDAAANISVVLGLRSGGLVDIDLDDPAAAAMARLFLPKTGFRFGHKSNPNSHWFYRVEGELPEYQKLTDADGECLVEIRSTGKQQTVLPGSIHKETGEIYKFEGTQQPEPGDIAVVETSAIVAAVHKLAAATILAKSYPRVTGKRHDIALALGGYLARLGWDLEEAEQFLKPVFGFARDDEFAHRLRDVSCSFSALAAGRKVTGLPRLIELLGDSVARIADLLPCYRMITADGAVANGQEGQGGGSGQDEGRGGAGHSGGGGSGGSEDSDGDASWGVIVLGHEIEPMMSALEELLANSGEVYQRAGQLVRVVSTDEGGKRLSEVSPATLRALASRYSWVKERTGMLGEITQQRVRPPKDVLEALRDQGHWTKLPKLRALATSPTLLADGTVLEEVGYHAGSGIFYSPSEDFDSVPVVKSKEEALGLLSELDEIFADFPFKDQKQDYAGVLGMVLTQLLRHTIDGPVPMFFVRAPAAASGKGLLADVVGNLTLGKPMLCHSFPRGNEEELRKTLFSLAFAGEPLVLFDNVVGSVQSPTLCNYLTSRTFGARILTTMSAVSTPSTTVIYATGNNIQPLGDLVRRTVCIDLDPKMELPEFRNNFKHKDLRAYVRSVRKRLVPLILGVVKAYLDAGRPEQVCTSIGSYEQWSEVVRQPLLWLGLGDPASKLIDARRAGDDDVANVAVFLRAWHEALGSKSTRTAEVLSNANENLKLALVDVLRGAHVDRLGALQGVKPSGLGRYLTSISDRIFNASHDGSFFGLRVTKGPRSADGVTWQVSRVGSDGKPVLGPATPEAPVRPKLDLEAEGEEENF